MKQMPVDRAVLERMLRYVTRHLTKDRLFAPMSPNGDPIMSVDSPYAQDILDGQYLSEWIGNTLNPPAKGDRRTDESQGVFDFFDRREP